MLRLLSSIKIGTYLFISKKNYVVTHVRSKLSSWRENFTKLINISDKENIGDGEQERVSTRL